MRASVMIVGLVSVGLCVVFAQPGQTQTDNTKTTKAETRTAKPKKSDTPDAKKAQRVKRQTKLAVERTRKQVRMLDDIYKTAIVLITKHYVTGNEDLAAGEAFKALFAAVKEKGWHEVRLLDATGEPINDENSAKTAFEKSAIVKLLAGESYVDNVIEVDGKKYLEAATAIPVVMDKCVMCHDNYADLPKGKAIGALGYRVPVE